MAIRLSINRQTSLKVIDRDADDADAALYYRPEVIVIVCVLDIITLCLYSSTVTVDYLNYYFIL